MLEGNINDIPMPETQNRQIDKPADAVAKAAPESREAATGLNFKIEHRTDGGYRLTHMMDGRKSELALNLPNYRSALEIARMVEKVVILKQTCADVNALHDRVIASGVCSAYAEGNGGMGSSVLKIADDGTVPTAKVREVRGDKPMAEGWRTKLDSAATAFQRILGVDKQVYDGYEIRDALGNPDHAGLKGNPETAKILSASPENAGKTFAAVIADFANAIPVNASKEKTQLTRAR